MGKRYSGCTPNSFMARVLTDTAAKCRGTASSPSLPASQARAVSRSDVPPATRARGVGCGAPATRGGGVVWVVGARPARRLRGEPTDDHPDIGEGMRDGTRKRGRG